MPERNPRRRHPGSGGGSSRKTRPPHPSASPRATRCGRASPSPAAPPNRNPPLSRIRNYRSGKTSRVLKRCASEPILRSNPTGNQRKKKKKKKKDPVMAILYSMIAQVIVVASPAWKITVGPRASRRSTGLELGPTYSLRLRLVWARDHLLDRASMCTREMRSLRCLERSELIGEVGSRNFYLRKSGSSRRKSSSGSLLGSSLATVERNSPSTKGVPPAIVLFQGFFGRKFSKIVRIMRRVWHMVVCLP
ncbi:unnamed protein product [Linum trigynum]|uniref:Uncharacterized protein n=1 Tax=Linum trigynum TaxID=586398 RepID=A0AAV2GCP4_9ROSI